MLTLFSSTLEVCWKLYFLLDMKNLPLRRGISVWAGLAIHNLHHIHRCRAKIRKKNHSDNAIYIRYILKHCNRKRLKINQHLTRIKGIRWCCCSQINISHFCDVSIEIGCRFQGNVTSVFSHAFHFPLK